jgi:hypothetical protein
MVIWKGCGRKLPWLSFRYYPDIYLEELRKPRNTSVRKTGIRAEI